MPAVIKVVHTKKEPTSYYVGRPSPLGNPFVWDRSTPRGSTIPAYRNWFLKQLYSDNRAFHRELNKLYSMARSKDELLLGCWCGENNPCHAQVIKDHLDWKMESERM